ncbi:MAG TPA: hypothetical protein VFO34_05175 [Candidatus Acidoferrales bacterium]|nr:hypothetical protein [Candidatus Acidoferrales bacterium]
MSLELIRSRVSRQQDGDWEFGYARGGRKNEVDGSFELSAEAVEKIWQQAIGPMPHIELQVHDVLKEWDRLKQWLSAEIESELQA